MADNNPNSIHRSTPLFIHGRDLSLEIDRLKMQVERLRNRPDSAALSSMRTYEEMLEARLRMLEPER